MWVRFYCDVVHLTTIQAILYSKTAGNYCIASKASSEQHCPPAHNDSSLTTEVQHKPIKVCFTSSFATKSRLSRAKA
jgi:hypothetical protein